MAGEREINARSEPGAGFFASCADSDALFPMRKNAATTSSGVRGIYLKRCNATTLNGFFDLEKESYEKRVKFRPQTLGLFSSRSAGSQPGPRGHSIVLLEVAASLLGRATGGGD